MRLLIGIMAPIAYVIIGGFVARRYYIRQHDKYGGVETIDVLFMWMFWFATMLMTICRTLWDRTIAAPTPKQKAEMMNEERNESEKQAKALAKEYNLPWKSPGK